MRTQSAAKSAMLDLSMRAAAFVAGVLLLSAVGTASADEPKMGGMLVVATTNDTQDLDIQKYLSSSQHNALLPIFDGLVGKDWTADADYPPIIPGLATEWSASDDGKIYTFKLREGVTFHDGTPFNAAAADFNFKRMTDPDHPYYDPQVGSTAQGVLKGLKGSKVVDDYTFQIELANPNMGFIEALASLPNYYMESPAAFEKYGKEVGQHAVGTGPFKLVEWVRGQRTVMARNDDYWGKKPYVDQMIYRPILEPAARAAALKAGEVQIAWDLPVDQVDAFKADSRFDVFLRGIPATKVIECWQKSGPFSDVNVRKAVNMAINKKAIVDAVYLGTGVPATNPIPPTQWSYNKAIKDDAFNPEEAKKLLAAAGLKDGFTTDLWAMPVQRPYNPNAKRIAELMQADLAKVGIKAEIKSFEWGEYRKRMQAGEHQMGMLGWTGDNGDPDNFLNTLLGCSSAKSNGSNVAKFCYQPFEDLIQKAKVVSNPAERTKLYEKAQVIFKEQAPWFTIAHAVQIKPVRKEVIGFKLSPFGRHSFYGVDMAK